MRVEPIVPDAAVAAPAQSGDSNLFASMLGDLGAALNSASLSEDGFATGHGDLQSAVYERARADVALSVATAAAQRSAQALQSILNMQV